MGNEAQGYRCTLQPLVNQKYLSDLMATKMSKVGVNYDQLKVAFETNGFNGLLVFLGEEINGVVKVTKYRPSIVKIQKYFEQIYASAD